MAATPTLRHTGRLSTLAAAYVVARRDFTAILLSRSFIFFLLGPLLPVLVGMLAGGIDHKVRDAATPPALGVAMTAADVAALTAAHHRLAAQLGEDLPTLVVLQRLTPGAAFDPALAMRHDRANLGAVLTGSLAQPVLAGPRNRIDNWRGLTAILIAEARASTPTAYPRLQLARIATSTADQAELRLVTAQLGQTVLFMLTMVLAGMVLANLVEEKSNKIIEVLAAAIPMDAVFLGKLFAMLAVSWVGIVVWAAVGGAIWQAAGHSLSEYSAPALGWPAFIGLGMIYFSIGYLLIGSIFLALGSLASTVREVQTLSMPATMLQLLNFFFASYAIGQSAGAAPNPTVLAAMIVPFSSPFTMLAQAALRTMWWPHLIAIAWQLCWVAVLIRAGALLFRVRVMHSGPAGGPGKARWWPRWLRRTAG
ncbi:MAG: hypothetical protein RLZZ427_603 [Pseudomonadota bacterium]|jgi:ABC-2 type transport system permease protein